MKLAVIGAGVVGVTTAYELALDGHEVTVFERRHTVAEEASFANGALIHPGWVPSLAGGRRGWRSLTPWTAVRTGLKLERLPRAGEWSWLWQWLRAGQPDPQATSQKHLHRLACYSHQRLQALSTAMQLDYDRSQGLLVLWRTPQEFEQMHGALQRLRALGMEMREWSGQDTRTLEPALNPDTPLHAAIELFGDAVANCRQFTLLIKAQAQSLNCRFAFGTRVERIEVDGGVTLTYVLGDGSDPTEPPFSERFEAAVLCAGAASAELLRPLGLRVPLQPVYGHSISAAIREPMDAPLSGVLDARHGVSITRLGQRVRVAGGARLGGRPGLKSAAELRRLYQVLADWFPGAARIGGQQDSVLEWQGARAMLPDGPPVLGASRLPGLWLNLGHGDSGWTTACGSARALADAIRGSSPDIDLSAYSPQRFDL